MKKIYKIIQSRFRKPKNESWVEERRKICSKCEYNSKNKPSKLITKLILKFFSDTYSFITLNKEEDVLGNCNACDACSIFYKTESTEDSEKCPKNKWKQ